MSGRFAGKAIVITGGAGGIGRATAERFASEGASVAVVDLPGTALDEAAAAAKAAGGDARGVPADVTKSSDLERAVAEAARAFGGVDFIFNNAGIEGFYGSLMDYPEDIFDRVLDVNVKGVWRGIKAAVPELRKRGGGAIVNTSSVAGIGPANTLFAYGASKHAVIGMTRSAAMELAPDNIRVNAICPGPIDTRMMRSIERSQNADFPDDVRKAMSARVPLGRYGKPAEIAAMVAFLCSDDSQYITGKYFVVDGGMRT